jgi:hypothetical protein
MTPAYCRENSLNILEWEKGGAIKILPKTTITPAVQPDVISRESFLIMDNWPSVTLSELASDNVDECNSDDLRALRDSLKKPENDLDFAVVQKELDL